MISKLQSHQILHRTHFTTDQTALEVGGLVQIALDYNRCQAIGLFKVVTDLLRYLTAHLLDQLLVGDLGHLTWLDKVVGGVIQYIQVPIQLTLDRLLLLIQIRTPGQQTRILRMEIGLDKPINIWA